MGLKLDDPSFEEKVKELADNSDGESMSKKALFYRDQIQGCFCSCFFFLFANKLVCPLPSDLRQQRDNLLIEIKTTFVEYNKL